MSQAAQLNGQIGLLVELSAILRAMKNIALAQSQRLARTAVHTEQALATIEQALADVVLRQPLGTPDRQFTRGSVLVAVGSERGFCGSFNESVAQAVEDRHRAGVAAGERLVVIGARLGALLQSRRLSAACVPGASVVEDVPHAVERLVDAIVSAGGAQPAGKVVLVGHWPGAARVADRTVFPPQLPAGSAHAVGYPPRTYLPHPVLIRQLLDQWLWAVLHAALYQSLAVETRQRLAHLDSATRRTEERAGELRARYNVLRQEEITQEIEVIMLTSELTAGRRGRA